MKSEVKDNLLSFSAVVEFADDNSNEIVDVEINKNINALTYDEVEDAIYQAIDKKYGYSIEDFENDVPYSIVDIVINEDDGSYPVVPEDADDSELKESQEFTKYLVLPWVTYALTPEAKLWMNLKDNGIIDEDEPFDYEKYHNLVEAMNEKK